MTVRVRRGSAALLLLGVGFVVAAALGMARPARAATPPCHARVPTPASAPASAPCGAVLPLLCCGDRTLPVAVAAPPAAAATDLAFLPALPCSSEPLAPDAFGCRADARARAAPLLTTLRVLRL